MKKIKQLVQVFAIVFSLYTLQACREEAMEISELNRTEVTSYSDLFNTFWDTMNNDYNYFNEQQHQNWDNVYKEYNPKFKNLSTFNKGNVDPILAEKEANLAFKYFAEIVTNNIIDQHFNVAVTIPIPSAKGSNRQFSLREAFNSRMEYKYTEEDGFLNFGQQRSNPVVSQADVASVMSSQKLIPSSIIKQGPILAGFLKDNPETLYIQLSGFEVYPNSILDEQFPILSDISSADGINQSFFDNLKKLDNAKGTEIETLMKSNLNQFKTLISNTIKTTEYKNYEAGFTKFQNTELTEDLKNSFSPLANFVATEKTDFNTNYNNIRSLSLAYFTNPSTTQEQKEAINVLYGIYNQRITRYKKLSGFISTRLLFGFIPVDTEFDRMLTSLSLSLPFDLYDKLYNKITDGTAKKIVLDFRGNGGGYVFDARIFTERFVTQQKVWGYQRTKEGNGRFNYSPWVPVETKPHKLALKQNVPTAILIDGNSVSMAEISTMMIKSQGNHVTIVGDNSYGGTAGLGGQDTFNGGNRLNNGYLSFYMPLMAFKNSDGKIIESIGVTPDVKVIPTQEEVDQLTSTYVDPAFNAALQAVNK
ncbi:S41 family peptidase [Tenacibaculum sp. TC6]|uniref:S41 family peptidase n=1 Tax=Tenacibaculum sp. TC6 TaxID=3423223 RepID=UPI003D36EE80